MNNKGKNKFISAVLPVYNSELYVAEAIESILSQTYQNFELILIDDGSTDNSLNIMQGYESQDPRVKLLSQSNCGVVTTLIRAISLAQGKYIALMNSDDISAPHRFERQLQWMDETGAQICGSWVKTIGVRRGRVLKYPVTDSAIKIGLLFSSQFANPSVMMESSIFDKLKYDLTFTKGAEDYDLWEKAATLGIKMANVPEILLSYRLHPNQISNISSDDNHVFSQLIRRRYWNTFLNKESSKREWIDEILKIREPHPSNINMKHVDAAFLYLMENSNGEARETVFDHLTRLYYRVAANTPDIVSRWAGFNRKYGAGIGFLTKIRLCSLNLLAIETDGKIFKYLKKYIVK